VKRRGGDKVAEKVMIEAAHIMPEENDV